MKIVNSKATTALYDMLESLSERPHESWQCVYLKPVSANDAENAAYHAKNAGAIIKQLEGIKGTAYLCDDGDIIILVQRTAKQIVGKLSGFLGDIGADVPKGQHTHNLFGLFDLGKHWQGFYSLCVNKYLRAIARVEERFMGVPTPAQKPTPEFCYEETLQPALASVS